MSDHDKQLREHLAELLDGGHAHLTFDDAVKGFPRELRGTRPAGGPHSAWELLEHLRLAQWDILEFTRDANHVSPEWPKGYWPASEAPPSDEAWDQSVEAFRRDLQGLGELAREGDLFAKIPHGTGQTLLREILLAADHNAYHIGQLVTVKKQLGG